MKRIFFAIVALVFSIRLNATLPPNILWVTRDGKVVFTSYPSDPPTIVFWIRLNATLPLKNILWVTREEEVGFKSCPLKPAAIYFPFYCQQPSSEFVEVFSNVENAGFFYKTLFLNFGIFGDDIPEAFGNLSQNPIGRALLYRIGIELLRVNENREPCFSDGKIRPKNGKTYFPGIDSAPVCTEIPSSEQFLFFKLLKYFHKLQPERTTDILKNMLCTELGEDVVNKYISQKKEEEEKEIVSSLFLWYGISPCCKNYRPGDELSLRHYCEPSKIGYCPTLQNYTLHIKLSQGKGPTFFVCLNNSWFVECKEISDVFEYLYQFFYESLSTNRNTE